MIQYYGTLLDNFISLTVEDFFKSVIKTYVDDDDQIVYVVTWNVDDDNDIERELEFSDEEKVREFITERVKKNITMGII